MGIIEVSLLQAQYNNVLERINRADEYFLDKWLTESEERKELAVKRLEGLLIESERLYKRLRPNSSRQQMQYGFGLDTMSIGGKVEVDADIESFMERIAIYAENGWEVVGLEYLKQSNTLIASLKR